MIIANNYAAMQTVNKHNKLPTGKVVEINQVGATGNMRPKLAAAARQALNCNKLLLLQKLVFVPLMQAQINTHAAQMDFHLHCVGHAPCRLIRDVQLWM
jgi:hypothetical protein